MAKFNKAFFAQIVVIGAISLLPFLWLQGGSVIVGHDAGTPISPSAHFQDRLQAWTHRYGLGANQTFATPGVFVHGLEYTLDQLGLSLSHAQGVSFFMYMFGMGLAMFLLGKTLFPNKKYLPLIAAVIYQINHFTLQAWFIAERTKFTTYILLPILLLIIYSIARKKISITKLSIITAILVTILNGGGFLPLFGAILAVVPLWIIVLVLSSDNKKTIIKKYISYIFLTALFSFLLNIYWLYPYISYLRSSFSDVSNAAGGVEGVIAWLKSISLYSSYSNLFRLQGIPEWYSNPNHPYAHTMLYSKVFIIISFALPLLAFIPLVLAKKNKHIIALLTVTALVSMFFMAGSHAPLGWLYILLIKYLPGFIAFRTAFYKFAPGLWLAYSLLIAYSLDYFIIKLKKPIQIIAGVICIIAVLGYSYPFFTKSFFKYDIDRTTLLKIPEYVADYGKHSNNGEIQFNRLLTLPPQPRMNSAEHTQWNYWSLASVTSLLDQKSYVNRSVDLTEGERQIVSETYNNLDNDNPEWINLAHRLNIDGILLREDTTAYTQDGHIIDSNFYKKKLEALNMQKVQTFGKWSIYKLTNPLSDISTYTSYAVLKDLRHDLLFPDLGFQYSKVIDNNTLLINSLNAQDTDDPYKKADIILPSCEKCNFPARKLFDEKTDIIFFPGSRFYAIKKFIENKSEPKNAPIEKRLEFKTRQTLRRAFEMRRALEQKVDRGERIDGWNNYKIQIDQLDIIVSEYIKTSNKTSENNEFLNQILDNVEQQVIELNAMSEKITDAIEGIPFINLYQTVNKLYIKLDDNTYKTESITDKKYMFPIDKAGLYDVWIDPLSLLTPSHALAENDLKIMLNGKHTNKKIAAKNGWTLFTSQKLNAGTHTLEVTDTTPNLAIDSLLSNRTDIERIDNNQLYLKAVEQEQCKIIPMGILPRDKYRVSFNLRSEKYKSEVSVFIDSDKINDVLLPELTDTLDSTEIGSDHYENDFISNGVAPSTLKICQLFTQQRDNLFLTHLTLNRITAPKIALVRVNPRFVKTENVSIQTTKKNNTSYTIAIKPHKDIFLALHQRFDTGWELNNSNINNSQMHANFYAQSWRIPTSEDSEIFELNFKPQKDFEKGIIISLISFCILICGYITLEIWERKSKHS